MDINEYAEKAMTTAGYQGRTTFHGLQYVALGLAGEACEFAGKVSKLNRDDHMEFDQDIMDMMFESQRHALLDELGDVLWFVAVAADELGEDLSEVARRNIEKLRARQERGTINGSGDVR